MGQQQTLHYQQYDLKGTKYSLKSTKGYSLCLNHFDDSILTFGGYPGIDNQIYSLSLKNFEWIQVQVLGNKPVSRFDHSCFQFHEKMFIFGGEDEYGNKLKDVHYLSLENYEWNELKFTGDTPSVRSNHSSVIYKNQMILFGGESSKGYLNDCWSLNLENYTWKSLSFDKSITIPTPRASHSCCIHGHQMFIFGGINRIPNNELFVLDLDTLIWQRVLTTNSPIKRYGADLIVQSGTLILTGGYVEKDSPLNDVHALVFQENFSSTGDQSPVVSLSPKFEKKTSFSKLKLSWATLQNHDIKSSNHFRALCHEGKLILVGGNYFGQQITTLLETSLDLYHKLMNISSSEIKIEKQIGEGTFRNVYKGTFRGEKVCIKILKGKDNEKEWEKYLSEINILRRLKHPNIIGFRGVSTEPNNCLITEYAELGTLKEVLENHILSFEQKVVMALDISRGLQYIHSQNLIHGNLSDFNLLVTSEFRIKISDFFLSVKPFQNVVKIYGSVYYQSPQLLNGETPDRFSDIYALGIILWEIYSQKPLYDNEKNFEQLTKDVINGKRPFDMKEITKSSENEKDVIYLKNVKYCLSQDPQDRPSLESIIKSLKECINNQELNQYSSKYDILKLLGSGGQGIVYQVKDKTNNELYALKKYNETKLTYLNDVLQEMRIYINLNHKNILSIKDFYISDINKNGNCHFNVIMEFCQFGDLHLMLKKQNQPLTNEFIKNILIQILDGLRFIHSKKIIHRDMKSNNIFFKNSMEIKIGDLGLAKEFERDKTTMNTYVGTIDFMSPEQREQKSYSYPIDVWGLGTILYELLTLNTFNYHQYLENEHYMDIKGNYDPIFEKILKMCLQINPTMRATADELYHLLTDQDSLRPVYRQDEVIKWGKDRVGKWLEEMKLSEYIIYFNEHEIDGESLLEINSTEDLILMGVKKVGHMKILLKYISKMKSN